MSIDIRALARDAIAESPSHDPHVVAKIAAGKITGEQAIDLVEVLFPDVVRRIYRNDRNDALADGRGGTTHNSYRGNVPPKLRDRQDWWTRLLETNVHVGAGEWRPVGDCTVDNLEAAIMERQQQIAKLGNVIRDFGRLVDLLREHEVMVVRELPPQEAL